MKALIIAGGEKPSKELLRSIMKESFDLTIGADKGSEIFFDENIEPTYIVGDFDSADKYKIKELSDKGVQAIKYLEEKDFTDSESAFNLALDKGAKEIVMLGVTGTRMDHTLANLGLVFKGIEKSVSVTIYNENNKIYMLNKSGKIKFKEEYKYISFLAYKHDVKGLTIRDAKYRLNQYNLNIEDGITVSNEFIDGKDINLEFESGVLMVIHSKD